MAVSDGHIFSGTPEYFPGKTERKFFVRYRNVTLRPRRSLLLPVRPGPSARAVSGVGRAGNHLETSIFPEKPARPGPPTNFPGFRKGGGTVGGGGAGSRATNRAARHRVGNGRCAATGCGRTRSTPPTRRGMRAGWGGQKKEQGQRPCSGGSGGDERLLSSCADGPPRRDQPDRCRTTASWRVRGLGRLEQKDG